MPVLQIDIDEWDAAFEARCPVSEAELLERINASLRAWPELDCVVLTLRWADGPARNWNVAEFELGESHLQDRSKRLDLVARVMSEATDGYEVDWPSARLH